MDVMAIYNKSPIFMQNLFTSMRGYQYKQERNGKYYKKYMEFYKQFDVSDQKKVQEYQDNELQKLLKFAVENSPFYGEFYKGIDIDQIKTAEDLKQLPVLEKETVRKNLDKMYTLDERDAFVSHTSGTTGTPLKILHTFENLQHRNAVLDDFKRQHGFVSGQMKRASFNASEIIPSNQKRKIFWRDNLATKQRLYSSYHSHGENLKYYVENLNAYKPASLDGYPSTLYEVARYINKHELTLDFQPVAIFPTAEALLPHYREEIEQAFKSKVYDQYASSEGAPFVVECPEGNRHFHMLSGVIEQTEEDEMLVTSFMNTGTPLIRYQIGDKIIFDDPAKTCSCGSAFPLVKELQGRTTDYVLTKEHGKMTSVFLAVIGEEFKNSIIAMQFVQEQLDHVTVNIVPDITYEKAIDEALLEKLSYVLGKGMSIELRKLPEIPKDKSGKFKIIINPLARQMEK